MFDITGCDTTLSIEMDTDEFTETGGIVVTDSFGITKSFQNGIGLDDLIFQGDLNGDHFMLNFSKSILKIT